MRRLKLLLVLQLIVLIASAAIVSGQEIYSSIWDKGVVVVLYGSQYGTGWWVNRNHIVTAAHVVGFQNNVRVTLIHGNYESIGQVIYVDSLHDVAIIRAEKEMVGAYIWSLSIKGPEKGQKIFVIGYPFELYKIIGDIRVMSSNPRISEGVVAWVVSEKKLFEFSATTDAGNSGGPIVDPAGNVVGLVSFAIEGEVTSMFYGTTVDAVRAALQKAGVNYKTGLSSLVTGPSGYILQPALIAAIIGGAAAVITTLIVVPLAKRRRATGKATLALVGIVLVGVATVIQMIVDWYQTYAYGIPMPTVIKLLVLLAGFLSLLAVIISLKSSSKVKPYA